MAKRFSRYKFALKANEGASGGALQKYLNFTTGTTKLTRTAPTGDGDLLEKMLNPFAVDLGTNSLVVSHTSRAVDRASAIGLPIADLGLVVVDPNKVTTYSINPARASGAKFKAGTPKTSQITGVKYQKTTEDAFSIPFGRKTTTEKFAEAVLRMRGLVQANNSKHSISFQNEKLRF